MPQSRGNYKEKIKEIRNPMELEACQNSDSLGKQKKPSCPNSGEDHLPVENNTSFKAFGRKTQSKSQSKFDSAISVNNLKFAIEQILHEEWPLIRRRATFLSHEQKDKKYCTYPQDLKDLTEFAKFQDTLNWECRMNCKGRKIVCSTCGHGVQIQLDKLISQLFWNRIKNKYEANNNCKT